MNAVPSGAAVPPLRAPDELLRRMARAMAPRYTGQFGRETVDAYLRECHELLAARSSVATYLPVLAQRFAAQRLDALARTTGLAPKADPEVLFVCTENSGRSQLAAALLRAAATAPVRIHSAGTLPSADIDPVTLRLLREARLTPGTEFPKPLTTEIVQAADIVITLGCGDACPVVPGRQYLDWDLPDLKGLDIESARSVRDGLVARIERFDAGFLQLAPGTEA